MTHDYEAAYDVLNRRTTYTEIDRVTTSNELDTTYGYDSRGNLVWMVNAEGDPTRWTFDAAGRMTKKEVALATGATEEDFTSAIVTEWGFDENDRLTSHNDDAGNESTWTYDDLDRPTELKYPDLEKITYEYDDNGNVTKTTDAAGNVIDDTYDDNSRRTSRSVTRATGFLGTTSETFTYDGLGRMTLAQDNDYKVEFTYGVIGLSSQVYEEKQCYATGTPYQKIVKKTYDAAGNKLTELYPNNLDLDYTWNDINRLSTVTDGTNTIASYSYIGMRVKDIEFQNGTTSTYSYTGFRSEVERIHHETSTPTTILDLQYGYDDNHDRTYERFGGTSAVGNAFEYDKARRLTVAWMYSTNVTAPSSNPYTKKIEYTMDDDGNRSSVKATPYGQSATTTGYTDNNLNQYTVVGGTNRSHDDNGNLTDDGTLDFEYDYKNQIVRVKQATTTVVEYKYDALGRRVEKDVDGDVERYIYSGHETVNVYDGSDVIQKSFVFGQVIDEILMLEQADVLDFDEDSNTTETTRSFYHVNALGSVMEITEMDEDVAVSYRYDPYGAVTIIRNSTQQSSDPLGNPWMYTARFMDAETGLYYYRARAYSPVTGRFLQRDPLGYGDSANLYEYVRSSPTGMVDPMGMESRRTGRERNHQTVKKEISRTQKVGTNTVQWEDGDECFQAEVLATWDEVVYELIEKFQAEVEWEDRYWQRVGSDMQDIGGAIGGVSGGVEAAKTTGGKLAKAASKIAGKASGWGVVIGVGTWLVGTALSRWGSVTRTDWVDDERSLGFVTEIENFRIVYVGTAVKVPCADEEILLGKIENGCRVLPEFSGTGRGGGADGPLQPGSGWRSRDKKKKG